MVRSLPHRRVRRAVLTEFGSLMGGVDPEITSEVPLGEREGVVAGIWRKNLLREAEVGAESGASTMFFG